MVARAGAAIVTATGTVRRLDGRATPTQRLTSEQVQDPERLAREVNDLREKATTQANRHAPRWIDFEDLACTTASTHRLPHGFGGRVRWWVVDWTSAGTPLVDSNGDTVNVYSPMLVKTNETDENTLVLQSYIGGTATIRVEAAG